MRKKITLFSLMCSFFVFGAATPVFADGINVSLGNGGDMTSSVNLLVAVTVLTLAPSFLIMFTCFTHVAIVLGLTKQGLGAQNLPPNQVMTGLALFITVFIMFPVAAQINHDAYQPYKAKTLTLSQAAVKAEKPIKEFMIKNTYDGDLRVFLKLRNDPKPKTPDEVSIWAAVPAYSLSQITKGLFTGLMIYIAFVVIDIIVASVLMFMGMMMITPQQISLPLKILVFVLIGGFSQVIEILFSSIKT